MSTFAARQRGALLVLAAISDGQALERTLADTDVMDALGDTRPFRVASITKCMHMATSKVSKASRI